MRINPLKLLLWMMFLFKEKILDEIDRTQKDLDFLSEIHKPNLKKEAEPTGYCLFCGEKLTEPNRRWCDAHCRDGWEKERRNK